MPADAVVNMPLMQPSQATTVFLSSDFSCCRSKGLATCEFRENPHTRQIIKGSAGEDLVTSPALFNITDANSQAD